MGKARPKQEKPTSERAASSRLVAVGAVGVALAALGTYWLRQQSPAQASSPSAASPVAASPRAAERSKSPPPIKLLGSSGALASFSAAHHASLLWGTYRPGVYFGMRSLNKSTFSIFPFRFVAMDHIRASHGVKYE